MGGARYATLVRSPAITIATTLQKKLSSQHMCKTTVRPRSRSANYTSKRWSASAEVTWMPLAATRLEVLQVRKLIQCVRQQDSNQIAKLVELGIFGVIDYQGKLSGAACGSQL